MITMGPLCLEQLTQDETLEEVCAGPIREVTTQLSLSSCSLALLRSGVLNPSVNHS
jgi:hypothetical protein